MFSNPQVFYEALSIDVHIYLVEINQNVVYFKCKKPVDYVASKVESYGYGYSYYEKGDEP
jgi:hypothetical protein